MMDKEGSTNIVNLVTLRVRVVVLGRGHFSHIVKMLNSYGNPLLLTQVRQTKYIVMITKGESSKIVNFMTLRLRVGVLVCDHI